MSKLKQVRIIEAPRTTAPSSKMSIPKNPAVKKPRRMEIRFVVQLDEDPPSPERLPSGVNTPPRMIMTNEIISPHDISFAVRRWLFVFSNSASDILIGSASRAVLMALYPLL